MRRKGWMTRKRNFLLAFFILSFLGWSQWAQAQEFPTRPITMLIAYAPGAGTDVNARVAGQGVSKILGQELIPTNRPGGGGAVSAGILASSKSDGYTILAAPSNPFTTTPHLESVAYDPLKDFIPIIEFGSLNIAILVRADSPYTSLKELVEFARKNPGRVSYGIPGVGTSSHLAMEHVIDVEKVNIAVIPFAGGAPAATALLGGHVTASGVSTSGFLSHLKAGKIRVLATASEKRLDVTPETPTLHELGYPYGVIVEKYMIVAPKGTPSVVVKKLEDAFRKAMETTEFRNTAENLKTYAANPLSGQELKKYIENEYAKIGEIIQKSKLSK